MKTCKTCNFFTRYMAADRGTCECPNFIDLSKYELDSRIEKERASRSLCVSVIGGGGSVGLSVGEDFGCIHHDDSEEGK